MKGTYSAIDFGYGISYDKRNQPYKPTSGYLSRFFQRLPIVSDGSPILNGYEINTYKEIADNMIVSLSYYGRAINSLEDGIVINKSGKQKMEYYIGTNNVSMKITISPEDVPVFNNEFITT